MRGALAALATTLAFLGAIQPALAHQARNSVVQLDFGSRSVRAELLLPVSELGYALASPTAAATASAPDDGVVAAYVARHVGATTPGGAPWQLRVESVDRVLYEQHAYLKVGVELRPPPEASTREFTWTDDAITHEVRNHYIMVLARSDYTSGLIGVEPQLLGFLQYPERQLAMARTDKTRGAGFGTAFLLGVRHIAAGTDHLLFLLTLLLPAGLVARGGEWLGRRSLGATARRLVTLVSAFTLGHSITLVGAAGFGWQAPSQPVEILVAMSILVSAAHAWRPLFPGREWQLAAGFGLVHGLAFASVLGRHLVDPAERALALAGFNLGIECLQLIIVVAAAPLIAALHPGGAAAWTRRLAAGLAGTVAIGWAAERATGSSNPITAAIEYGLESPVQTLAAAVVALGASLVLRSAWTARHGRRRYTNG